MNKVDFMLRDVREALEYLAYVGMKVEYHRLDIHPNGEANERHIEKEVDAVYHHIVERFRDILDQANSEEVFRDRCKRFTNDTTKCEYCNNKFKCWTIR